MENVKIPYKTIIAVVILVVGGMSGCAGIEIVNTGHRGIKTTYGKVQPEVMEEGLYWYNPITSSIREMNVQTERQDVKLVTYTRDTQQATVEFVVNYNLDKNKAAEVFRDVGEEWAEKLIPQAIQGAVTNTIGKWDAADLVANRDRARNDMQVALTNTLAVKDVTVTGLEIVDIKFTTEFEQAVEAKVKAIQEAEQAKNQTVRVTEEAKQKVIAAEAEAKSMTIRSEALSQNQALVAYEAVQKWNGALPQYLLGDSVPLLNMGGAGERQ